MKRLRPVLNLKDMPVPPMDTQVCGPRGDNNLANHRTLELADYRQRALVNHSHTFIVRHSCQSLFDNFPFFHNEAAILYTNIPKPINTSK